MENLLSLKLIPMALPFKPRKPDTTSADNQNRFTQYREIAAYLDTAAKHRILAGKAYDAGEYEKATQHNMLAQRYTHLAKKAQQNELKHAKPGAFLNTGPGDHRMQFLVMSVHEN